MPALNFGYYFCTLPTTYRANKKFRTNYSFFYLIKLPQITCILPWPIRTLQLVRVHSEFYITSWEPRGTLSCVEVFLLAEGYGSRRRALLKPAPAHFADGFIPWL